MTTEIFGLELADCANDDDVDAAIAGFLAIGWTEVNGVRVFHDVDGVDYCHTMLEREV